MWLIVGLGNPGEEYHLSRHNVGFWAIDNIAQKRGISLTKKCHQAIWGEGRLGGSRILISKPQTFMNKSGLSVKSMLAFSNIDITNLILIHDDMDLQLATVRVKSQGGSGGHKGVQSVINYLDSSSFLRIRIGIGRPAPFIDPVDFVLGRCSPLEREELLSIIQKTDEIAETIIKDGPESAMSLFNR